MRDTSATRPLAALLAGAGQGDVGVLLVVAHPDDEIVGAGALLPTLRRVQVVYVTDGAPGDGRDARAAGFATRRAYAEARRAESLAALALAGIPPAATRWLGFTDQEAMDGLIPLTAALGAVIDEQSPALVITHPYEGGHPDHDAAAFAASAALARVAGAGGAVLAELASYHAAPDGQVRRLEHLPSPGGGAESATDQVVMPLSPASLALKRRMLAAFATQAGVLAPFPLGPERFRVAPRYDFTAPPHAGTLHYERLPWGRTGAAFRARAAAAAAEMLAPPRGRWS